jgi:probable rRNA maturation factor
MATLDTRNMTRRPAPRFPYEKALAAVLPGWDISLVFAGSTRAKSLNEKLRGKEYVPNVLSYESGKKSGEVIICLEVAKRQAPLYELSYPDFTGYLFIHALMHLKGYPHGPTMEKKERALLARFVTVPTNSLNASTNIHRN